MYYRLITSLLKYKDLDITSILLNEGKLADEVRKLGISVTVVDETRFNTLQIVKKIRQNIKHLSPDIIHSHRRKENILAYYSVRPGNKIQMVCTQHGMSEPLNYNIKRLQNVALSKYNLYIMSKYFKRVIAVSEDIKNNFIQNYGFKIDNVLLIHNGTNVPDISSFNKDDNIYVIGSAGRLFKVKDYPLMVEIAREISQKTDKIKFVLAGDGPERETILDMVKKYKIEKTFILTGFIDNMNNFYNDLDLYINTSLHEGLPMSILEAMSHGLPVVAPRSGGIPEILKNGLHGFLVDARNPKMFAEKCLQLYWDRALSRRMGDASREKIIDEFSLEKMAEKYYNLYVNILNTSAVISK